MSNRLRRAVLPLVLMGIAIAFVGSAAAQEVTLQYRWNKGEETRYRLVQQVTTTMSSGVGDMTIGLNMSQMLRTRVDEVSADGTATLNYQFESARWEMSSPMGTMVYDSAAPESAGSAPVSSVLKDALSAIVGESFTIVISARGEVQKVEGMSRLLDKMTKSLPPNPATAPILQGLRTSMSDEAMRGTLANSYSQFPDRPLKLGDTWDTDVTAVNPMSGRVTTHVTYGLKSVEGAANDRVATIDTKLTMKSDQSGSGIPQIPFKTTLGDASGEGELRFDVGKGRVQRATMRTKMPMQISGTGPDGTAINMQSLLSTVVTMEIVP